MLDEDEARARRTYDTVAVDYAQAFPDLAAETSDDRALIDDFAGRTSGSGPVLDLGCGTGRVAAHLTSLGLKTVGMDLSGGMLREARRLHPSLPVVIGSVTRLPFANDAAAGLLAWYSIIHTAPRDLPVVLAGFVRVLAVGAPVLLAFQCGQGERLDRTGAFGHDVQRTNYRHDVRYVSALLDDLGVSTTDSVVRAPVAVHETTPQAFLLGTRGR